MGKSWAVAGLICSCMQFSTLQRTFDNGDTRINTAITGTYLPAWAGAYACWNYAGGKGTVQADDEMARLDEWRYGILSSEDSAVGWCWYISSTRHEKRLS